MNTNEMWKVYDYYDLKKADEGKLAWDKVQPICYGHSQERIGYAAELIEERLPDVLIGNPGETPQDVYRRWKSE